MRMSEAYWDHHAKIYEREIFDVFKNNKGGKLQSYMRACADKNSDAIDFGCGVGKGLKYLSPLFRHVTAVDISQQCLDIASGRSSQFKNVTFQKRDLAKEKVIAPNAHFGFCCNVAMLPDIELNRNIITTAYKSLAKNSSAIFVLPSLESFMFSTWQLIEWHTRDGTKPKDVPDSVFGLPEEKVKNIFQGLVHLDGVLTKHFLEEELHVLFTSAKFTVEKIEKLEYDWSTEFPDGFPSWLRAPYPWDWMILCSKK